MFQCATRLAYNKKENFHVKKWRSVLKDTIKGQSNIQFDKKKLVAKYKKIQNSVHTTLHRKLQYQ